MSSLISSSLHLRTWSRSALLAIRNNSTKTGNSVRAARRIDHLIHPRGTRAGRKNIKPRPIDTVIDHFERQYDQCGIVASSPGANARNHVTISPIQTVLSKRRKHEPVSSRNVDFTNLIRIPGVSSYFHQRDLRIALWNARSLCNNLPDICASILSQETDIFLLTETWLSSNPRQEVVLGEFRSLSGYKLLSNPRKHRRGGGVGVVVRDNLKVQSNKSGSYESFEHTDLNIFVNSKVLHLLNIYRPPPSKVNRLSVHEFFSEFSSLLESVIVSPGILMIPGDFNFPMEN